MALTWRTLIRRTLEDLKITGQGQAPSANDETTSLDRLNDWLDALKIENLSIYQTVRTTWPLTGAASYSVGVGGAVNVARPPSPDFISGLGFINTNVSPAYEYASGPPITDAEWMRIPFKTLQAMYPAGFYYEQTFPLGTLTPYPVPTGSNLQGVMYSGVPIDEVTVITADTGLPPGYRRFVRLGLRLELADAFGADPGPTTAALYAAAKAAIFRMNETIQEVGFGTAGRLFSGGEAKSNIYTGDA